MRRLIPILLVAACGCATPYKHALCSLGQSSAIVSTHYLEYVAADNDLDRKSARLAESTQFQQAVAEANQQCLQ